MSRQQLSVIWLSTLPVPAALTGEAELSVTAAAAVRLVGRDFDSPVVVVTDRQAMVAEACAAGLPCIGIERGVERLSAPYIYESETDIDREAIERAYRRFHQLPLTIAKTKRLTIRELSEADFEFVLTLADSDPAAADERLTGEKLSSQIRVAYPFYGFGIWLIESAPGQRDDKLRPIGILSFSPDAMPAIGYQLLPEERGQGLAAEAAAAGLAYMRELGYEAFVCRIAADNKASQRVAEKLGFVRCADGNWNWTSKSQSIYNKGDT
ncbi:MAG: GNAT family N-acetyltransferase [Lachnospiraceae bacterium]|nr:GNAT family N-acetyltransferase [Lachnospiraceae bacterium]